MSEHLEHRIAALEQELTATKAAHKRRRLILWLGIALLVIITGVGTTAFILKQASKAGNLTDKTTYQRQNGFPVDVAHRASFPVLYPKSKLPDSLALDQNSIQLTDGILIFRLNNTASGSAITVTEQALPQNLQNSRIQGKEKVDGVNGDATVSYDGTRVIGYLTTKDKRTMVVMNSATSDNADIIKSLLRNLQPIK